MAKISRRDLILLILGVGTEAKKKAGISGMTRLQKLLFLIKQDVRLEEKGSGFEFEPYIAGPYCAKVYDDLEFLENIGFIESEVSGEATEVESSEVDFTFEELIGDDSDKLKTPDVYDERRFYLTEKGKNRVESLLKSEVFQPVIDGIRKVKSKFGHYSLDDLLYYVYTKYPEMATESEIKDRVLRRRRRV